MTDFNMELDIIQSEIKRLTTEVTCLRAEYDLDDGVDDELEQAEIDELDQMIEELRLREAEIIAETGGVTEEEDGPPPDFELDPIEIIASDPIDYYADELQQFFGTRMANWASRCSQAILGARTELNVVEVPSKGFGASNLYDIAKIIPGTGQYVAACKVLVALTTSFIDAMDVKPGRNFADIGHDLSKHWIELQRLFSSDSDERREMYEEFVVAFKGSDKGDTVPRDLIRREIEIYAAAKAEPTKIAREFLLKCFDCLDDPWIEMGSPFEEEGYETGSVRMKFYFNGDKFYYSGGYIDDAPGALVDALKRNFGGETKCIDLPLSIEILCKTGYLDIGDDDDDEKTAETLYTYFSVTRRSRKAGSNNFAISGVGGRSPYATAAEKRMLAAFESQSPQCLPELRQLTGD